MKIIILALLGLFSTSIAFGQTFGGFKGLPVFNKINDQNLTQLLKNAASTGGVTGGGMVLPTFDFDNSTTDFMNTDEFENFVQNNIKKNGNVITLDPNKLDIQEIHFNNGHSIYLDQNNPFNVGNSIYDMPESYPKKTISLKFSKEGLIKLDANEIQKIKVNSRDVYSEHF